MSNKSLGKRKFEELKIGDIVKNVNKKIKKNQTINNRIFSELTESERDMLKGHWINEVINLINESCSDIEYLVVDFTIVEDATVELNKMSFLQIWAIYVALVLKKNLFMTGDAGTGKPRVLKFIMAYYYLIHRIKIEVTASTGRAALELKSTGKSG